MAIKSFPSFTPYEIHEKPEGGMWQRDIGNTVEKFCLCANPKSLVGLISSNGSVILIPGFMDSWERLEDPVYR